MLTFCDDRYKLLRRIGQGSFGSVFACSKVKNEQQTPPSGGSTISNNSVPTTQSASFNSPPPQESPRTPLTQNNHTSSSVAATSTTSDSFSLSTNAASLPGVVEDPNNHIHHPAGERSEFDAEGEGTLQDHAQQEEQQQVQQPPQLYVCKLEQLPPTQAQSSQPQHQQGGGGGEKESEEQQKQQQKNASRSHLTREYKFYTYMHECCEDLQGFPQVYDFGIEGDFRFLVMDLLGPSLDSLFRAKGKQFTQLTILRLAQQMISRLELLHSLGIVHRDIKPDNWCMGMHDKSHCLYLLDLGLAKMFRDRKTGEHVAVQNSRRLAGTARYTSIWTHDGISQSRRDDLEGVWFTLLYFSRGGFPWDSGPTDVSVDSYIRNQKKRNSVESLCKPIDEPLRTFLISYIDEVRSYGFAQTPDYDRLRDLCQTALADLGSPKHIESLGDFCWFHKNIAEGPGGDSANWELDSNLSGGGGGGGGGAGVGMFGLPLSPSMVSARTSARGNTAVSSRMSQQSSSAIYSSRRSSQMSPRSESNMTPRSERYHHNEGEHPPPSFAERNTEMLSQQRLHQQLLTQHSVQQQPTGGTTTTAMATSAAGGGLVGNGNNASSGRLPEAQLGSFRRQQEFL